MTNINLSDYKLLLAEDDPDEVIHLRRALKVAELNPPFWVARDGQEAVDFLKRELEDNMAQPKTTVLFLDLRMPRMNGFEVLEWIRQQPGLRSLIVIVLTSSEDPRDERRAYETGANSYVIKPGDPDDLAKTVKTLLMFRLYWDNTHNTPAETFAGTRPGGSLQLTDAA